MLFLLLSWPARELWAQEALPIKPTIRCRSTLHHYEFYIFGGVDGTPAEIDSTGPAFEFNWGAIPRVQLHAILPWGRRPVEQSRLFPGGTGSSAFGLTDMELGVKSPLSKRPSTPADRHLHHVRDADRQLCQRSRRGQGLVQTADLVAKELRAMAL